MRLSEFSRCALGLSAAVVLIAGCGGIASVPQTGGQPFAPAGATPEWQARHEAHAACPERPGEPTCLALILEGNLHRGVSGWTPADLQARYKLPSKTKGAGQIVAVVDAYDNPNVASDLAKYRLNFGLGTATFAKYNERGQKKNYPKRNLSWGLEEDLDVEMVSAICPKCTIYLVEADDTSGLSLDVAEDQAVRLGAHIVSNSWICYGSITCVSAASFSKPGVVYLAAAGDRGFDQFGAPMAFDSVAAVGGTVLSKSGSHYSESGWPGSGSGCVTEIQKPTWQHDKYCSGRLTTDTSAVAWGVAEYDSYGRYGGWFTIGGTSISSPVLAGIFALAGNAQKQEGGRTFWQDANEKYLYDLCRSECVFDQYSFTIGWGSPSGIGAF
jgi:subtilase family serine protease